MKLKKWIHLLISFNLVFSLVSCKSNENETREKTGTNTDLHKQAPQNTKTFKIGAILPMTGSAAAFGMYIKRGIELAIEDVNKQNPIKLEAVIEDSETKADEGLKDFQKLSKTEKIKVIIPAFSLICNVVAPKAEENKVLMLGTATTLRELTKGKNYVLRVFPNSDMMSEPLANFAKSRYKSVAVLYVNDDYGKDSHKAFKNILEKSQTKIVFSESFSADETQFRTTVAKMASLKPEAVFIPGYGKGTISLLTQIKEQSPTTQVLSDLVLGLPAIFKGKGAAVENALVLSTPLNTGRAETEDQKSFLKSYKSKFNENPTNNTLLAYDAIKMLAEAINKTDGTPESIRKYYLTFKNYRGMTGNITMKPNGESDVTFNAMMKIKNDNLEWEGYINKK